MAVVKMHQASDGSVHANFDLFAKHEEGIKIRQAMLASGLNAFSGYGQDDRDNEVIFSMEHAENGPTITDWVIANADKLRNILNGAVVSKRGRKGAVAA